LKTKSFSIRATIIFLAPVAVHAASQIAQWDFDGSYAASNGNFAYDLTPGGAVALVPSPWGTAAEFHGGTYPITDAATYSNVNLDRLDTTITRTSASFNGGFSIMGWVKPYSISDPIGSVLALDSSSFSLNSLGFALVVDSTVELAVRDTSDHRAIATASGTPIAAGNWYHIAATWGGSTSDSFALYINGEAVATDVEDLGGFGGLNGSISLPIRVGGNLGDSLQNVASFNGAIDHLALFDGVLTPADVGAAYAGSVPESSTAIFGAAGVLATHLTIRWLLQTRAHNGTKTVNGEERDQMASG
jgi:hypothetical protein